MAVNIFSNITARGVSAVFNEAMDRYPSVWQRACTVVPTDSADVEHAWLGVLPQPREFVSGRNFRAIQDFTYNVKNKEYELSFIIDQNSIEDDKTGDINRRISDCAEVWAAYKDYQYAQLLENGDATGYVDFTGATFFHATHTAIGASGTWDSVLGQDITTTTAPTEAEARITLPTFLNFFHSMKDDQGNLGYNAGAWGDFRVVGHPQYAPVFTELSQSELIIGGQSNPFYKGLFAFDSLPFLTASDVTIYGLLCGAQRKPLIYQERTGLQIEVINDPQHVATNHGVTVLCRQRYRMWYGEPRRAAELIYT